MLFNELVFILKKINKEIDALVSEFLTHAKYFDIEPTDGPLLLYMQNNPTTKMTELSKISNQTKAGMSRKINRLKKLGYISHQRCQKDKRISWLELTPKGRMIAEKFMEILSALNKQLLALIPNHQQNDLLETLTFLSNELSKK